jgi:hypothetical protein
MNTTQSASTLKIVSMWLLFVATIVGVTILAFWLNGGMAHRPVADESDLRSGGLVHSLFYFMAGAFFLVLGVSGYFAVILTTCMTFDFRRPVWGEVKGKQYVANIIVPVALGLGGGFMLSAFVQTPLRRLGLDAGMANMAPLLVIIVAFQVVQMWVLIWAPVEKRMIVKRLAAQGVTGEHLQNATLVGLSNPASGLAKRFAAIEEDMGALWVTPDLLMYRGDSEQWDLRRDQVLNIERKVDNRSTTVLAGIAHVILHAQQPDGTVRQIRLHVEGLWTMGQKKHVMDALASRITNWHTGAGN